MEKSINKGKDKSDWRADHPSYFHSYTDYINGTLLITLKKMYSPLAWSAEWASINRGRCEIRKAAVPSHQRQKEALTA